MDRESRVKGLLDRWDALKNDDLQAQGNFRKYAQVWAEQIAILSELSFLKCEHIPGEQEPVVVLWAQKGKRLTGFRQMISESGSRY